MATTSQPPPPPKKTNVLLWVLVGIGGFFLLIALVVGVGIAYVARNPTLVLTKMITAANPNVEVVTVDKGSQLITLRDKKTGKTYSITFNDVRNGKLTMKDGEGHASFTMGGNAKIPAWVPDYPGSDPKAAFSAQSTEGESGTFTFKTADPSEKVTKFYRDQLQASGLQIGKNVTASATGMLIAQDPAKKHTVTVVIGAEGSETTVGVTYATSK